MPGGWSSEQLQNARTISAVGLSMGMSTRDIQIALMAAMQESSLRNLNYGDRDSLGLFQQRPSAGWGSRAQVTDPVYASRKFFSALSRVHNRNSLSLWQAAQKVQVSAFPRAYAKWEGSASNLMRQLDAGGVAPTPAAPKLGSFEVMAPQQETAPQQQGSTSTAPGASPVQNPMASAMDKILADGIGQQGPASAADDAVGVGAADKPIDWAQWTPQDAQMETGVGVQGGPLDLPTGTGNATGLRGAVLNFAKTLIGTPYVWGGTDPSRGLDCSGFTQYVLRHMGVSVPRLAYQQARFGTQTSIRNLKPGDLVFWGNASHSQGNHIAFYLGGNKIIEAPRPGLSVRVRSLGGWDKDHSAIGVKLNY